MFYHNNRSSNVCPLQILLAINHFFQILNQHVYAITSGSRQPRIKVDHREIKLWSKLNVNYNYKL